MANPFNVSDQPIMGGDLVTPTGTDVILNDARYVRCGGAGNLVLRYPASAADITIAVNAAEYVPVGPGTIIRNAGTTATVLHALSC